jgi:hypothetical protein
MVGDADQLFVEVGVAAKEEGRLAVSAMAIAVTT